jgi:hypothetical protein
MLQTKLLSAAAPLSFVREAKFVKVRPVETARHESGHERATNETRMRHEWAANETRMSDK